MNHLLLNVAAQPSPISDYFTSMFKKLLGQPWYIWAVVILLVVFASVLYTSNKKTNWNSKMLANAALCIALSFILSTIRLWKMPQGGSITAFSMLPIMLFSISYGFLPGLVAGAAYGMLQLLQDMYVVHPLQLLLDYPVAFGALAIAALCMKLPDSKYRLAIAVLVGVFGRLVCSVLSGAVFFAEYAPEGTPAIVYSFVYNITYMGPEAILCAIIVSMPAMKKLTGILPTGNLKNHS